MMNFIKRLQQFIAGHEPPTPEEIMEHTETAEYTVTGDHKYTAAAVTTTDPPLGFWATAHHQNDALEMAVSLAKIGRAHV